MSFAGAGAWYGSYSLMDSMARLSLNISNKKLSGANQQVGQAVGFGTAVTVPYFRSMFFPPPDTVYAEVKPGSNILVTFYKRQVAYIRQFPVIYYGRSLVASAVAASCAQRIYNKTHDTVA
jgi:hypothetical protein